MHTWYDGAKVYFYAETPESIAQDDHLKVTPSDHMTVNGEEHLLTSMDGLMEPGCAGLM